MAFFLKQFKQLKTVQNMCLSTFVHLAEGRDGRSWLKRNNYNDLKKEKRKKRDINLFYESPKSHRSPTPSLLPILRLFTAQCFPVIRPFWTSISFTRWLGCIANVTHSPPVAAHSHQALGGKRFDWLWAMGMGGVCYFGIFRKCTGKLNIFIDKSNKNHFNTLYAYTVLFNKTKNVFLQMLLLYNKYLNFKMLYL